MGSDAAKFSFYIAFIGLVVLALILTYASSFARRRTHPHGTPLIFQTRRQRDVLGPPPELFDAWIPPRLGEGDKSGQTLNPRWRGMKPISAAAFNYATATDCKTSLREAEAYAAGQPQAPSTSAMPAASTSAGAAQPIGATASPSSPPATTPALEPAPPRPRRTLWQRTRTTFLIPTLQEAPFHRPPTAAPTPHGDGPGPSHFPSQMDGLTPTAMQVSVLIAMPSPRPATSLRYADAKAVEAGVVDEDGDEGKPLGPYMLGVADIRRVPDSEEG